MGQLFSKLFKSTESLDIPNIKTVWLRNVTKTPHFFERMLNNVCKRDTGVANMLLAEKFAETKEEEKYILTMLADSIEEFFSNLINDNKISNKEEFRRTCFVLGMEHAGYTQQWFPISHWDVFILAVSDELESEDVKGEELKAWQCLMRSIVDIMKEGYAHGKKSQGVHKQSADLNTH